MQYRSFGETDFKVSTLGFGCLRLPVKDAGSNAFSPNVTEEEAIENIRYGIDHGINYVDTSYLYHSGRSEEVVGKALKDGYRQKAKLKTKSPVYLFKEADDFDKYLDEQLKRLDTDYVDYYIFHALCDDTWENAVVKFELLDKMEKAKRDGKIGHIGFSFHDRYEYFNKIVDGYDKWETCMIQLNLLDTEYQAGIKGMKYAASKGIPIEIMEPLLGGRLANVPKAVQEIYDSYPTKKNPVEWALDYLWDMPEVSCILSGMTTMQQVKDNLEYADRSYVGMLTPDDKKLIQRVQDKFKEYSSIPCTKCAYCMPCPIGIDIPVAFDLYNITCMSDELDGSEEMNKSASELFGERFPSKLCIGCKKCEKHCPQFIEISSLMPKVQELLKVRGKMQID